MKHYKSVRHILACASAIALGACSVNSYSTSPGVAATEQAGGNSQSALMAYADDLALRGDHAAAIPIYRHLGASTGDARALEALGRSLAAQGIHDEAIRVFAILAKRHQLDGDGWYNYGKASLALGRFEDALGAFEQASALLPADARIRSAHAISLATLGRTDEAMQQFNMVVDPAGLSNRALVMAALGQADAAAAILEPLVGAGLVGPRGRQNLAMAYLMAGKETEARQVARLDLDPQTVNETFTFYRSLASLPVEARMRALVTGAVDPAWTRTEMANLRLEDNADAQAAAMRLVAEPPVMVAEAVPEPEPEPEPEPAPVEDRSNYVLTETPPLLEPEGWALQIAAYRTIEELKRGWTILYRQSGDLLQDIPPRRSEVDFGDRDTKPRGFYYRLNAGPLKTLGEARFLCRQLKERGTDCWIRPPEIAEGRLPDKKPGATPEAQEGQSANSR